MSTSTSATITSSTLSACTQSSSSSFYTILPLQDMPYMANNTIDSLQEKTLIRCGLFCASNSLCRLFVYTKSTLNCSLYKQSPTQFVPSLISTVYIKG